MIEEVRSTYNRQFKKRFICYTRVPTQKHIYWVRKIPWRGKWQPTPVFLPGKSHGQRSLVGYSPWGRKELDTHTHTHTHTCKRMLKFTAWGRFPSAVVGLSAQCWRMWRQRETWMENCALGSLWPLYAHTWPFSALLLPWRLTSRSSQSAAFQLGLANRR